MNSVGATPPPVSSSSAVNGDKLSGQLIIKAQLGDDIRKMMIHNEDLTLNELVLMMERIFAGKISNSDEITIKYLDEDGDKITLLNDSDLTVALHFHKLLRLFVCINGQEQVQTSENLADKQGNLIDAKTFRTELQQIRNSVQTILDRLQLPESSHDKETSGASSSNAAIASAAAPAAPPLAVPSSTTREFDPYKNAAFTQQRSSTPDSIRSKSSTANAINNNEQKSFQPAPSSSVEQSNESHHQPPPSSSSFAPTQMPQPYYNTQQPYGAPSNNDQQAKNNAFGPPPTSFPGMPPLPNNPNQTRFPTGFPPVNPQSNNSTPSAFNSTATPPPPPSAATSGQPSAFLGQQTGPPQQQGFYGQQQQQGFYAQQQQTRPPMGGYNPSNAGNNAFAPPTQQTPAQAPPSSSSPATITPSFVPPPPMASQQPYGGYPPQNAYYNPGQAYPKAT